MKSLAVPGLIVLAVILSVPAIFGALFAGAAPPNPPVREPNFTTPGQDASVVLLVVVGSALWYLWHRFEGVRHVVSSMFGALLGRGRDQLQRDPRASQMIRNGALFHGRNPFAGTNDRPPKHGSKQRPEIDQLGR